MHTLATENVRGATAAVGTTTMRIVSYIGIHEVNVQQRLLYALPCKQSKHTSNIQQYSRKQQQPQTVGGETTAAGESGGNF